MCNDKGKKREGFMVTKRRFNKGKYTLTIYSLKGRPFRFIILKLFFISTEIKPNTCVTNQEVCSFSRKVRNFFTNQMRFDRGELIGHPQ